MVLPSVSCLAVSPVAVQVVLPCECSEPKKIALLIAASMINDFMIDDLRRTQEVWVLEILDKGETNDDG
ncbi:unnamed protein product [Fusarium graminearum]|uniref:Uncharacterized protein n=1 Tax=Gibberella zeae TaxID=5518 RepID=A0A4E9EAQ6_GIBZA|nr:unnamed protein product [Fusarium graminearum]CAF3628515.1 unnamed protein product [Fusarium graminearum]CAG1961959.1 unnamed protein product [Fusarium graminearum]